jgi:hypothetical protein
MRNQKQKHSSIITTSRSQENADTTFLPFILIIHAFLFAISSVTSILRAATEKLSLIVLSLEERRQ